MWLEAAGIVARQNFTCCKTCGFYEINGEMEAARAQGRVVRGYVFFHMQDTERAAKGGDLALAYGPADQTSSDLDYEAVGRLVAMAGVGLAGTAGLAADQDPGDGAVTGQPPARLGSPGRPRAGCSTSGGRGARQMYGPTSRPLGFERRPASGGVPIAVLGGHRQSLRPDPERAPAP